MGHKILTEDGTVEKEMPASEVSEVLVKEVSEQKVPELTPEQQALLRKIHVAIGKELVRRRDLVQLESARLQAVEQAYAKYGTRADVKSIEAYYDGMAASLDPKINGAADMLSMAIDNALDSKDTLKIQLANGSVRTLDRDVAEIMAFCVNGSAEEQAEIPQPLRKAALQLHKLMGENVERQIEFSKGVPMTPAQREAERKDERLRQLQALESPEF